MTQLDGRVAIVTGGVQGIGGGVAHSLARAGANIVVAEAVQERISPAVARLEGLGVQALGVQTDVTQADAVDRLVGQTLERFGKIDILVNNAGIVVLNRMRRPDRGRLGPGAGREPQGRVPVLSPRRPGDGKAERAAPSSISPPSPPCTTPCPMCPTRPQRPALSP